MTKKGAPSPTSMIQYRRDSKQLHQKSCRVLYKHKQGIFLFLIIKHKSDYLRSAELSSWILPETWQLKIRLKTFSCMVARAPGCRKPPCHPKLFTDRLLYELRNKQQEESYQWPQGEDTWGDKGKRSRVWTSYARKKMDCLGIREDRILIMASLANILRSDLATLKKGILLRILKKFTFPRFFVELKGMLLIPFISSKIVMTIWQLSSASGIEYQKGHSRKSSVYKRFPVTPRHGWR
jgi:hypothetical protein